MGPAHQAGGALRHLRAAHFGRSDSSYSIHQCRTYKRDRLLPIRKDATPLVYCANSPEDSMKPCLALVLAVVSVCCPSPASAQQKATVQNVPEIAYTSVPNFLSVPPGETLGEAVGIATNSKGQSSSISAVRTRVCGNSTRTVSSSKKSARVTTVLNSRILFALMRKTTFGPSMKARTSSRSSVLKAES